jgi:hypothetical protein
MRMLSHTATGKLSNDIDGVGIKLLDFAQHLKHDQKQVVDSMQPAVEAAFAEHRGDVTALVEQTPGLFPVPAEVKTATMAVVITSASLI